ncbi:MAG: metallophosphoesterase [Novosphingobium sp.]|nr:metallophosphoesterase [Novosphingobium sp.]
MTLFRKWPALHALLAFVLLLFAPGAEARTAADVSQQFRIAVISDTQHYLSYKNQTRAGFPFDAVEMFFDQMRYIADNSIANGGDIVFATAVGDVWEHQSRLSHPDNEARGIKPIANPRLVGILEVTARTRDTEMPAALAGYRLIAGKLPFSVVPGNHDYDAQFTDSRFPPSPDPAAKTGSGPGFYGMLYSSGLDNFREVFGSQSTFFRDQPWYVASHRGGASSAQIFTAGGYEFLHIGLEMAPDDETLAWAQSVLKRYPNRPAIVTTHDHLNSDGSRTPNAVVDWKAVDPRHNSPEDVWRKFIRKNDQILFVLSGHERGQAFRDDANAFGHRVYQLLADFQDRTQTYRTAMNDPSAIGPTGDGWFRLMEFDMRGQTPVVRVRTYSTHYKAYSTQLPAYAAWYRADDAPEMTDDAYLGKDDFVIRLVDFHERFPRRQ